METRELVLLSCSEEFSALVEACRRMPVPQMRIGSFVMLCFDCGTLLPRGRVERAGGTERCRVHIFDWDARSLTLRVRTRSSGKAAKTTGHSTGLLLLRGCRAAARLLQSLRGQILTEEAQPSLHTPGQGPLPGRQLIGTRIVVFRRKLVPTGMGSHTSGARRKIAASSVGSMGALAAAHSLKYDTMLGTPQADAGAGCGVRQVRPWWLHLATLHARLPAASSRKAKLGIGPAVAGLIDTAVLVTFGYPFRLSLRFRSALVLLLPGFRRSYAGLFSFGTMAKVSSAVTGSVATVVLSTFA